MPGIQQTLALILWRLDAVRCAWVPVRGLAEQVLLPRVLEELRATKYPHNTDGWILGGYVLDPLRDFGLLENRSGGEWHLFEASDAIRVTPLWRRVIRFAPPL